MTTLRKGVEFRTGRDAADCEILSTVGVLAVFEAAFGGVGVLVEFIASIADAG